MTCKRIYITQEVSFSFRFNVKKKIIESENVCACDV